AGHAILPCRRNADAACGFAGMPSTKRCGFGGTAGALPRRRQVSRMQTFSKLSPDFHLPKRPAIPTLCAMNFLVLSLLVLSFLLAGPVLLLATGSVPLSGDWATASRHPAGLAPDPQTT